MKTCKHCGAVEPRYDTYDEGTFARIPADDADGNRRVALELHSLLCEIGELVGHSGDFVTMPGLIRSKWGPRS